MSGGVDSSVSAALLARDGHEVIGITLRLWTPSPWIKGERHGGCCSPKDIAEAKQVCRDLGVPHYTYDLEQKFKEKVVDNFVSEYLEGNTPNPCVRCNSFIKFDVLLKYAVALEADYLATGHYARIEGGPSPYRLCKAADPSKDQSYFLYMLDQAQLSKVLFPLGSFPKTAVREMAEKFALATACKPDSQDVCFLEGRDYREFLSERTPAAVKGPIKTKEGKVLGEHQGLAFYTIGQREKLGISAPERLYVIEKNTGTNTLVVGTHEENASEGCALKSVNWCSEPEGREVRALVKLRYRHPGAMATITRLPQGEASVRFDSAQASVTSGQSAVFYDGDQVLGGGVIVKS